jgi:hypothetical protein
MAVAAMAAALALAAVLVLSDRAGEPMGEAVAVGVVEVEAEAVAAVCMAILDSMPRIWLARSTAALLAS